MDKSKAHIFHMLAIHLLLFMFVVGNSDNSISDNSVSVTRSSNYASDTLFTVDVSNFQHNSEPVSEFTVSYITSALFVGNDPFIVCNGDISDKNAIIENKTPGKVVFVKLSSNVTTFPLHVLFHNSVTSPQGAVTLIFTSSSNISVEVELPELELGGRSIGPPNLDVSVSYYYNAKKYTNTKELSKAIPVGGMITYNLKFDHIALLMNGNNNMIPVSVILLNNAVPGSLKRTISVATLDGEPNLTNEVACSQTPDVPCAHPHTFLVSRYHPGTYIVSITLDDIDYKAYHSGLIEAPFKLDMDQVNIQSSASLQLDFLTHRPGTLSATVGSIIVHDQLLFSVLLTNKLNQGRVMTLTLPEHLDYSVEPSTCDITSPSLYPLTLTTLQTSCILNLVATPSFTVADTSFTVKTDTTSTDISDYVRSYLGPSLKLTPNLNTNGLFTIRISGLVNNLVPISKFTLSLISKSSESTKWAIFTKDPKVPMTLTPSDDRTSVTVTLLASVDPSVAIISIPVQIFFQETQVDDFYITLTHSMGLDNSEDSVTISSPLPSILRDKLDLSDIDMKLKNVYFTSTSTQETYTLGTDLVPVVFSQGYFKLTFNPIFPSGLQLNGIYPLSIWVKVSHITGFHEYWVDIVDKSTQEKRMVIPSLSACPNDNSNQCIMFTFDMSYGDNLDIEVDIHVDKYLYDSYNDNSFFFTYYFGDSTDIPLVIHKNFDLTGFQYPPLLALIKPISNEPVPLVDSEIQITDVVKSKSRAAVRYAIVLTALPETPLVAYLSTPFGLSPNSLSTQIVEQVGCSGFKLTMDSELRMLKGVLNKRVEGNNEMVECQLVIEELFNYSDVGGEFPSDAMNTLNSDPVTHSYNQNYVFKYLSELNLNVFLDVENAKDSTSVIAHSASGLSAFSIKAEYLDQRELVLSHFILELNLGPNEIIQIKNIDYLKYDFPLSIDMLSQTGLTLNSKSHGFAIENPSGSSYGSGTYMVHVHIPSTVMTDTVSISIDFGGNDMLMLSKTKSSSVEISFKVPNRPRPLTPDELEEILKVTKDNIYRDKETGGDGGSHVIDIEQTIDSEVDTDVNVDVIWTPGTDSELEMMDDLDSLLDKDSFVDSLNDKGFNVDKKDVQVKEKEMSDVCENVCGRLGCKRCVIGDKCTAHTQCVTGVCKDGFCIEKPDDDDDEEKEGNNNASLNYSKNTILGIMGVVLLIFLQ